MVATNHTHDPAARSWVAGANRPDADFPIQNLPFAVFQRPDEQHRWRGGVAIGDRDGGATRSCRTLRDRGARAHHASSGNVGKGDTRMFSITILPEAACKYTMRRR